MTDITPQPSLAASGTPPTAFLSAEEILDLQNKCRENHAAQLRGDPPPHQITPEMLRHAIQSVRARRGTVKMGEERAKASAGKPATGRAKVSKVDLNSLDLDGL